MTFCHRHRHWVVIITSRASLKRRFRGHLIITPSLDANASNQSCHLFQNDWLMMTSPKFSRWVSRTGRLDLELVSLFNSSRDSSREIFGRQSRLGIGSTTWSSVQMSTHLNNISGSISRFFNPFLKLIIFAFIDPS